MSDSAKLFLINSMEFDSAKPSSSSQNCFAIILIFGLTLISSFIFRSAISPKKAILTDLK